jgi:hypothetical protein
LNIIVKNGKEWTRLITDFMKEDNAKSSKVWLYYPQSCCTLILLTSD